MLDIDRQSLSHDPIHGYIPFTSGKGLPPDESSERDVIDHPWVQRLRYIHQLQTAWLVFPTAEHMRFQHVLGVMHLASRATSRLYDSLREQHPDAPSRGYVETLLRMAGLLHDVGHGPFGHFYDDHFLQGYGLTHETLGSHIIRYELGDLLRNLRGNPNSRLEPGETLDPEHVAYLIARPKGADVQPDRPGWLQALRSLFSGIYTVDNMDFVLRDAYMSGYSISPFDLDRILHYSFFSERGLTIHSSGLAALVRFITARAELFRAIYFHRTVRAIDLSLADLFAESKHHLFPGNPLENLSEYRDFHEMSLLVDVARWERSDDDAKHCLGARWRQFLNRQIPWKMACERTLFFHPHDAERSSIFSDAEFVELKLRQQLPAELADMPLRVDLARHVHRPGSRGPTAGLNFLYDASHDRIRELNDDALFRRIPVSYRICRVYVQDRSHNALLAAALDSLIGSEAEDDLTNM